MSEVAEIIPKCQPCIHPICEIVPWKNNDLKKIHSKQADNATKIQRVTKGKENEKDKRK